MIDNYLKSVIAGCFEAKGGVKPNVLVRRRPTLAFAKYPFVCSAGGSMKATLPRTKMTPSEMT